MKYKDLSDFEIRQLIYQVRDVQNLLEFIKEHRVVLFENNEYKEQEFTEAYYDLIFSKRKFNLDDFFRTNLEILAKGLELYNNKKILNNIRDLDSIRKQYVNPSDIYIGRLGDYYNYLFCYAYYYNLASWKLDELYKYFIENSSSIIEWARLNGVIKPFDYFGTTKGSCLVDNECYYHITQHILDEKNNKEIR